MDDNNGFSKGSKIIEDGKVYLIYKTEMIKSDSIVDKILHYRPYYSNVTNITVSCTIPSKHLISSNIRKPHTRLEISKVITYLSTKEEFKTENLLEEAKNLKLNSLYQTARVLKQALKIQKSTGKDFDLSKKGVINDSVQLMLEEIALVYDITLEKAYQKIKIASKTYYSGV